MQPGPASTARDGAGSTASGSTSAEPRCATRSGPARAGASTTARRGTRCRGRSAAPSATSRDEVVERGLVGDPTRFHAAHVIAFRARAPLSAPSARRSYERSTSVWSSARWRTITSVKPISAKSANAAVDLFRSADVQGAPGRSRGSRRATTGPATRSASASSAPTWTSRRIAIGRPCPRRAGRTHRGTCSSSSRASPAWPRARRGTRRPAGRRDRSRAEPTRRSTLRAAPAAPARSGRARSATARSSITSSPAHKRRTMSSACLEPRDTAAASSARTRRTVRTAAERALHDERPRRDRRERADLFGDEHRMPQRQQEQRARGPVVPLGRAAARASGRSGSRGPARCGGRRRTGCRARRRARRAPARSSSARLDVRPWVRSRCAATPRSS